MPSTRSWRWAAPLAITAAVLALVGCTNDESDAGSDNDPVTAPIGDSVIELAVLQPGSSYVQALCSIDYFNPDDLEDPLGWLSAEFESVPTNSDDEASELSWIIERIERVQDLDDATTTEDLTSLGGVLRARCAR